MLSTRNLWTASAHSGESACRSVLAPAGGQFNICPMQWSKVEVFNAFLHKVKGDLIGTRYSSFWDYIVTGECSCHSNTKHRIQTDSVEPLVLPLYVAFFYPCRGCYLGD